MIEAFAFPATHVPPATARQIGDLKTGLRSAGVDLVALGTERRSAAILAAAELLRDHSGAVGHYLDRHVAPSAGLSREMVRWATAEVLDGLLECGLSEILASRLEGGPFRHPVRPRACGIVLAGNVFTACLQPVIFALGLGIPVFCKSASGQVAFPLLLQWALSCVDAQVAQAFQVATFSRDDIDSAKAFLGNSDLVIGYGDDETMRMLRCQTEPSTRLVEHGHGLSVAYVGAAAMSDPRTAAGLALDIAAYDQRGCLSPQIVWLGGGSPETAKQDFLQALDAALTDIQRTLPRGPLGTGAAAAQMQWRAIAAIEGRLIEAPDHAIAYGPVGRLGPGPQSRNILVRHCHGPQELAANIARFGTHLKQIGIAADDSETSLLLAALAANQTPRICAIGKMQRPAFDAYSEGLDPADGLLKWIQVTVAP